MESKHRNIRFLLLSDMSHGEQILLAPLQGDSLIPHPNSFLIEACAIFLKGKFMGTPWKVSAVSLQPGVKNKQSQEVQGVAPSPRPSQRGAGSPAVKVLFCFSCLRGPL